MVDQAIKFCYIVNHLLFQQQYLKIGIHNINLAYNERNHFYIFLFLPAHQTYKAVQRIIVYILDFVRFKCFFRINFNLQCLL